MRSSIIALLLFLIIMITVIGNAIYVSTLCQDISDVAQKLPDSEQKEICVTELKNLWNKHRLWLDLSIKLNEIERMSDLIESLDAAYKADNQAEISKYCILISELAQEFAEHEKLSFRSIC